MLKLKNKELKLLYTINLNCRQNAKELAKASGFTPSFVVQKIKEFESEGIITDFITQIDYSRFSYRPYRINLFFRNLLSETHEKILQHIEETKEVLDLEILDKDFGISIIYISKDHDLLQKFLASIKKEFNNFLTTHTINRLDKLDKFPYAYLLGKAVDDSEKVFPLKMESPVNLDPHDRRILTILANEAQASLIKLSRQTGIPPRTIRYRITRLEKKKIILGYRAIINKRLIGYKKFKISFESSTPLDTIKDFARLNPHVTTYEEHSPFDHILTVETESIESLMNIINNLKERFAPLKSYSYTYIAEQRKQAVFMPT
ncbi:winged helix-turn-helix transcriptional regulator [Nanoarchaeota archaeon]